MFYTVAEYIYSKIYLFNVKKKKKKKYQGYWTSTAKGNGSPSISIPYEIKW